MSTCTELHVQVYNCSCDRLDCWWWFWWRGRSTVLRPIAANIMRGGRSICRNYRSLTGWFHTDGYWHRQQLPYCSLRVWRRAATKQVTSSHGKTEQPALSKRWFGNWMSLFAYTPWWRERHGRERKALLCIVLFLLTIGTQQRVRILSFGGQSFS